MPKEMEDKLKRQASTHKDWSDERKDAYVYGTLRKTGWKPEREKHGSLEDITLHEELASSKVAFDKGLHPVHKGYGSEKGQKDLETAGAIQWGTDETRPMDGTPVDGAYPGDGPSWLGSCNRDIGNGTHAGAPVDYFGPDTDYRAEEIDTHQYGRDYDPIPLRDYYKSDDHMADRTFRVMEQDEYDNTVTPGAVTDEMPSAEAYGAVNYQGAGPDKEDGVKAGHCDYRSFKSQREFARTNKERRQEYAVDVSDLDTKEGKDIR